MANKHQKNKRTLDIPKEITDALSVPPVEYLRKWWLANSTDEERKAADDRDATIEGAYEFVEDFSRRAKHENGACLPDQVVYDLTGIFMRICVDGDVYATAEEIRKDEEDAKRQKEAEEKRKADMEKRKAEAAKKEEERLAALSPEEREAYEKEKAERAEKDEQAKAEAEAQRKAREAEEKVKREKREAAARRKALAEGKIHPKFSIIIPSSQTEMVTEGRAMKNCIGGYWEHSDWKQGKTEVAFIHLDGKPYIDVEFRDGKIVQARYKKNEAVSKGTKDYAMCQFVTTAFRRVA